MPHWFQEKLETRCKAFSADKSHELVGTHITEFDSGSSVLCQAISHCFFFIFMSKHLRIEAHF